MFLLGQDEWPDMERRSSMGARGVYLAFFAGVVPAAACGDFGGAAQMGQVESWQAGLGNSKRVPNNLPIDSDGGKAATYSTNGFLDFSSAFHTAQGSNGRDCTTCHAPEDGWGLRPQTAQRLFEESDGLHPLFNILDADYPGADVSTVEARRQAYSMLLQGKFLRLRKPPASREYDIVAAEDPFGVGNTSQLLFFRRPPATANLRSNTVMWDGANTVAGDLHAGLSKQAAGNVTGAQQGQPASPATIKEIVDYELSLSHAQLLVDGVGRLDSDGALGGPEAHASQPLVAGRFDLFDAWIGHSNPRRAQIARGQELFNNPNAPTGRRCGSCHNAANSGQNVGGILFDVGASNPAYRRSDMAVYTLRNRASGELLQTTDWGRGGSTGKWNDLNRFKTPTLRGLAARAPYFHNGIADTLLDVVRFYEVALGFDFSPDEEADLAAFLGAL
jgi:cytochrome c peroxidase